MILPAEIVVHIQLQHSIGAQPRQLPFPIGVFRIVDPSFCHLGEGTTQLFDPLSVVRPVIGLLNVQKISIGVKGNTRENSAPAKAVIHPVLGVILGKALTQAIVIVQPKAANIVPLAILPYVFPTTVKWGNIR